MTEGKENCPSPEPLGPHSLVNEYSFATCATGEALVVGAGSRR